MVTAIILAGGLGTRLAQVVPHLPKALAPIQGTPFLELLLRQLDQSKLISKVIFALGYRSNSIEHFLDRRLYSFAIELSIESTPLGTGGALLHALDKADNETLLVLNGDSYCDLSLSDFYNFHQNHKADISMACRRVEDTSRYGAVEIDSSQRIVSFREKSQAAQAGWINAGLYLMQKSLFTSFVPGIYSLEKDFFPMFLNRQIVAYMNTGTFIDIGTPNSYNEAQEILKPWTLV